MKEIKLVDEKQGIVKITTEDERFYARPSKNPITGLPEYEYVPSVTWIAGFYPKGIAFWKWLAAKGWDEAEALKQSAGDKGSKIHLAIADLLSKDDKGKPKEVIWNDSKYLNRTTGQPEELTPDEYEAVMSFAEWYKQEQPKAILGSEFVVWGDGYAGTVDILYRKQDDRLTILDVKSSKNVWPEHELQLSAYREAIADSEHMIEGMIIGEPITLEILQVGYKKNKNKFKVTEIENQYPLFLAAKQIWSKETEGVSPLQRDFPLSISLVEKKIEEKVIELNKRKKKDSE